MFSGYLRKAESFLVQPPIPWPSLVVDELVHSVLQVSKQPNNYHKTKKMQLQKLIKILSYKIISVHYFTATTEEIIVKGRPEIMIVGKLKCTMVTQIVNSIKK